ncbi:xanthine dehydrogenase accessory protein XdhC [Peredibacter starrii]|uniref:Xanthine dehydrogenase accessory protein XdhC n=1 Tax=Peredibacter starrii TaxID=28202 RepID=A0AAX4HKF3_9BACT|nr:xanthine dehydrogenase accessory protein XdhC [Peredibacter starrii]WPU63677.1 xanthine dehydrogenase accessory protein XdhC [Peredibacter starrii]
MTIWEACQKLTSEGTSFVMVTMTGVRGSAPQDIGAKMLVTKDGLFYGTVGGGKVEMASIKKSQEILKGEQSPPESVVWNLQKDIGMSCGGEVVMLFEHHHQSNWPIVIFGAGHVAQALTRILSKLNCSVTCVDSREEWVAKLEGVKGIHHPTPKEMVKEFSPHCYFMSMTMGHAHDVPILHEIAKHAPDCPYIGVIGSDVKGIKIKKELKDLGVSDEFLKKLRVPMGLPIGTNQPYEIAISIVAELLQVRDAALEKT